MFVFFPIILLKLFSFRSTFSLVYLFVHLIEYADYLASSLTVLLSLQISSFIDLFLFHSVQTKLQLSISELFLNPHQGLVLMILLTSNPLLPLHI